MASNIEELFWNWWNFVLVLCAHVNSCGRLTLKQVNFIVILVVKAKLWNTASSSKCYADVHPEMLVWLPKPELLIFLELWHDRQRQNSNSKCGALNYGKLEKKQAWESVLKWLWQPATEMAICVCLFVFSYILDTDIMSSYCTNCVALHFIYHSFVHVPYVFKCSFFVTAITMAL